MPEDVDEDLGDHDQHHDEDVEVPARHRAEYGYGLVGGKAEDPGDRADDVDRRRDVDARRDGDLPDHVEPRRRPRPGPAAQPEGPEIQTAGGGIGRSELRHRGGDAEREDAHDRPTDRVDEWARELEAISKEEDGPGQDRDDGEGDGEVRESAHLAEELLSVAQAMEIPDVLLDELLAGRRARGHTRSPFSGGKTAGVGSEMLPGSPSVKALPPGRTPPPADERPRDDFISGPEDQRIEQSRRCDAEERWRLEVHYGEVAPGSGCDAADLQPEGPTAPGRRRGEAALGNISVTIRKRAAHLTLEALAVLEPSHVLEHREARIRVAPETEASTGGMWQRQRRNSVAEVTLGQRAEADAAAGGQEGFHVPVRGMGTVDRRKVAAAVERLENDRHRCAAIGMAALFDLFPLLFNMDVKRQPSAHRFVIHGSDLGWSGGPDAVRDTTQ